MNHFKKIYYLLKAIGVQFKEWFLELPRYKQIVAVVGSIAIIVIAVRILPSKTTVAEVAELPPHVILANVADLSNDTAPVPLVGQVASVNEAVIRAQSSGQLTRVYKKLGDYVSAGQLIGEFQNSAERAAVLQAQGAYEGAKAARDIAIINSQTTNTSGNDAKTNTINTINSIYVTLDDVVRSKTDVAFADPRTQNAKLKILFPDSILQTKIENERINIEAILIARQARNLTLTQDSDLLVELSKVQTETQTVKTYLDDLGSAYVKSLPDQNFSGSSLDAQKANLGVARSTVTGLLSGISASKVALQNSIAAQEIAGRTTGDNKNPNTAASDASVKSALGAYDAALARLENTIIRSPINGTLNSLTISTGDYVNQSTQVAVVSNNGALEIVAYVSGDDAQRIQVGSKVKINSSINGVVTRLAGAIDPVTKKIEVKIGITDQNSGLINGESVKIEIAGVTAADPRGSKQFPDPRGSAAKIKIPLSAVKITPRGSFVYIVSASSTLQSITVETGTLLGDSVEINSGLTADMQIVKDVRGLKEGDTVDTSTAIDATTTTQ